MKHANECHAPIYRKSPVNRKYTREHIHSPELFMGNDDRKTPTQMFQYDVKNKTRSNMFFVERSVTLPLFPIYRIFVSVQHS